MALTVGQSISLKGPQGAPGVSFLVGSGAPTGSAVEGQGYIDGDSGDLYKYTSNAWTKTKNLVGPMGLNGIDGSFFFGTGDPGSSTYSGDGQAIYLRNDGEIFTYIGHGGWQDTGENLTGPAGVAGAPGARGTMIYHGNGPFVAANYPNAAVGDMYFDDSAGSYAFITTA